MVPSNSVWQIKLLDAAIVPRSCKLSIGRASPAKGSIARRRSSTAMLVPAVARKEVVGSSGQSAAHFAVMHNGGNATGVHILTTSLEAKRLGLLHEMVARAESIGVLLNPNFPAAQDQIGQLQSAAQALRLRLNVLRASTPAAIGEAFEFVVREHISALVVAKCGPRPALTPR
jgi:ABC-type uncharacterized transport system substrate-binding protein